VDLDVRLVDLDSDLTHLDLNSGDFFTFFIFSLIENPDSQLEILNHRVL